MELTLTHKRQPLPWGCQNYALYALVGDERLLENTEECSAQRFMLRCFELGYFLLPLYQDSSCTVPAPAKVWELFARNLAELGNNQCIPLLLGVPSLNFADTHHMISGAFFRDAPQVWIFDPGVADEQRFETLTDFLASEYGQCHTLQQVGPVNTDWYGSCFGPDAPHVTPAVRKAWEDHKASQAA